MNSKQTPEDSQGLCSRDLSRRVRSIIKEQIVPFLTGDPDLLPTACQLNPVNDAFLYQESNKTEVQKGDWKCSYCNKVKKCPLALPDIHEMFSARNLTYSKIIVHYKPQRFKSELYIDRHMHNKHADHLSVRCDLKLEI